MKGGTLGESRAAIVGGGEDRRDYLLVINRPQVGNYTCLSFARVLTAFPELFDFLE